jgi:hypothetical protein
MHAESKLRIFSKGSTEQVRTMLEMFVRESPHKEDRILASSFRDVFEVFETGHLDLSNRETLLEVLRNMNNTEEERIKMTLTGIRRLQGDIYRAINSMDKDMVPDNFLSEGDVHFRGLQKHLGGLWDGKKNNGTVYVPFGTNIEQFADTVYTVVSNYGSHNKKFREASVSHKKCNKVSKYTLSAITFAMLDLLLWFKEFVRERSEGIH